MEPGTRPERLLKPERFGALSRLTRPTAPVQQRLHITGGTEIGTLPFMTALCQNPI